MAEFCKTCFKSQLMTTKEREKVESGEIILVISDDYDLCEGCGRYVPVVVQVREAQ